MIRYCLSIACTVHRNLIHTNQTFNFISIVATNTWSMRISFKKHKIFANSKSIHVGWCRKRSTFWVWVIKVAIMVVVKVVFSIVGVYGLRLHHRNCHVFDLIWIIRLFLWWIVNVTPSLRSKFMLFLIYIRWFMQENEKLIAGLENDNISSVMSLVAWETPVFTKNMKTHINKWKLIATFKEIISSHSSNGFFANCCCCCKKKRSLSHSMLLDRWRTNSYT